MPKPNSSRKGTRTQSSSSRTTTGGKSPRSRSTSGTKSSHRSKDDSFPEKGSRYSKSNQRSTEKPFKKSGPEDSRKSYGKRRDDSSFNPKRSFRSSSNTDERSEKPFKKDRKDSSKPYSKRAADKPFDKKRSFSKGSTTSDAGERSGKPFKKSGYDDSRKSYGKRAGDKPFNKKRSFESKSTERKDAHADERKGFAAKRKEVARPRERAGRKATDFDSPPPQTEKIRLNRFIANSGVCSRREADELITMGLIAVNGKTITELGYKVNPGDEVRYENKVLKAEKPVYILMNKPKGYLTTTNDPQERNTVMHIIGGAVKERVYPVGRLDRNTTGLLLLTNDGDLADKLMHPSYNVKKIYKVELDRALTKADFQRIQEGIQLEEGRAVVDDLAIVSDDGKTVGVELHIGWNRVVRRIFESLEYQVVKLDRSVYAGLDKKDLPRGHWRFLKNEEIVRLKHYK